ncbi:hypothetical protein BBJ28_00012774 [Nothophytophthora sp. Chile5]|nr:hypothetical protein BBJ28_00012774 [Nothophytophthora sp. Chile5]
MADAISSPSAAEFLDDLAPRLGETTTEVVDDTQVQPDEHHEHHAEDDGDTRSGVGLDQIPLHVNNDEQARESKGTKHHQESEHPVPEGGHETRACEPAGRGSGIQQLAPLSPSPATPKESSKVKKLAKKVEAPESPQLLTLESHPLLEFARTHFNLTAPRALPFHKPQEFDLAKRLEWDKQLISTPLMRLSKEQAPIAVQAFRNVSGFMGNRASGKGQIDHCFKLLRNVVHRSPTLKDEIYCQLCKQLTRNPSANAVMNGWLLLNACLVTFPPSPPLASCLERFISMHVGSSGQSEAAIEVAAYAMDGLASLHCCVTKSERKEIPSAAELRALQRHALNDVTVVLVDGSVVMMQVSAWTSSRDLASLVAHKLGVCHARVFALFEINDDAEEILVPDDARIMDLYAEWERTHVDTIDGKQKNKHKNKNNSKKAAAAPEPEAVPSVLQMPTGEGYRLIYKAYLWVHIDDETASDVGLYYLQAVQNVLGGSYICDLDAAVELAGYQLYCKLGGSQPANLSEITFNVHMPARRSTTTLFHVRNSRQRSVLPARVMLAINDMGVGILGADSDEVLALLPYADIANWGYSANSFVFNVVRGNEETEYSFKTAQTCKLLDAVLIQIFALLSVRDLEQ